MKHPSICAAIIARNEARDLPRCLASLRGVVDRIVIVDTGSTDGGIEAAMNNLDDGGRITITSDIYLDASEPNPDKPGEWRLTNFAKARNRALELAEATGATHLFWIDADDEVTTPLAVRRAAYMPLCNYGCWIELGGGVRQVHYRLIPAAWKLRFKGWVHEYLDMGARPQAVLNDACVRHDATPHASAGEDSNQRNLRILTAQYAAEPDARTAFYLANTHKDGGRLAQAALWYRIRLGYGDAFREEYLFALLYLGRALRAGGDLDGAAAVLADGLSLAPDWQEFRMELAFMHYAAKRYPEAIDEAARALDQPIPPTILWREPDKYTDQPARLISWCHEHMGNVAQSLAWSRTATALIGKPDADWAKREAVLEQRQAPPQAPAIVKGLRPKIALHRPGAIGDILMTLNLIPAFKEANPGADVHYFCNAALAKPDALGSIMVQAGVDLVMDDATLPAWEKQYERVIRLIGYPLAEGYPEKPMRTHLLHNFAAEMGLPFIIAGAKPSDNPYLPALTLRRPKRPELPYNRPYATIQRRAGWSKYKQWAGDWDQMQMILLADPDIVFVEIDERMGKSLAWSIAAFANASMHIGIDSFCNHLTNYFWEDERGNGRRVPGVILWGSTQASAAGYPHNTNISKGLPCQPCFRENPAMSQMPRGPCINPPRATYDDPTPHACMDAISVDEIVAVVREMWERTA